MGMFIDEFCGGGGTSEGYKLATGRDVDLARNHDPLAIEMHEANNRNTIHKCEDIWNDLNVDDQISGAWFSPDCRHFSRAKGGTPVKGKIRGLAWTAVKAARVSRPGVIFLENVREFQTWGPLIAKLDGRGRPTFDEKTGEPLMVPDPARKGQTFRRFVATLRGLGYVVEWRELNAADYGAPTHRWRFFLIARCDGQPIAWPEATHGPGRESPWRTAAECIDWSLPCPSIFLTKEEGKIVGVKRPLADNTMRRICAGLFRYVIDAADPFIVTCNHGGDEFRGHGIHEPFRTITGSRDAHGLVMAFISKHYGGVVGHGLRRPLGTVTQRDHHSLSAAYMVHLNHGEKQWSDARAPLRCITASGKHHAEVRAFLIKYYGSLTGQDQDLRNPLHTATSRARFGLVMVHGEPYQIVDIGMRMLTPRELARAQGFSEDYILTGTIENQIKRIGNSVPPPMAAAIIKANFRPEARRIAA